MTFALRDDGRVLVSRTTDEHEDLALGAFLLFFRYDSRSKVIVYAWANDAHTLRSAGSRSDAYAVFARMLERGAPQTSGTSW